MILYLVLKFFVSILGFVLSPLSTITTLPFGLDNDLSLVYSLVHSAIRVWPFIGIAMGYIILAVSIELSFFGWRIISYVARFIRGA